MPRIFRLATIMLVLAATANALAATKEMTVTLETAEIKAQPTMMASIVTKVKYGTKVTILEEGKTWLKVSTADSKTGWMHATSLTKATIKLAAAGSTAQTGASSGEVNLAGQGFNAQIEADYRAKNKDVDFTWIDRMIKLEVPVDSINAFIKEGALSVKEGGVK